MSPKSAIASPSMWTLKRHLQKKRKKKRKKEENIQRLSAKNLRVVDVIVLLLNPQAQRAAFWCYFVAGLFSSGVADSNAPVVFLYFCAEADFGCFSKSSFVS